MKKHVQVLCLGLGVMAIVTGCNKLGLTSETYVNEKDPRQVLELETKATVKGLIAGQPAPVGQYTFQNDQKVIGGTYVNLKDPAPPEGTETHVLVVKLDESTELKFWHLTRQPALRDEAGNIWKLQNRSHQLRGSATAQVLPPTLHDSK